MVARSDEAPFRDRNGRELAIGDRILVAYDRAGFYERQITHFTPKTVAAVDVRNGIVESVKPTNHISGDNMFNLTAYFWEEVEKRPELKDYLS